MNIFTVDLEDWYHANYRAEMPDAGGRPSTIGEPTLRLLDLLDKCRSRATFFCLGSVAQQQPELIGEIFRRGHEVASHGFSHQLVYGQSAAEFAADLRRSTSVLREIIGQDPVGYRAPSWSVDCRRTPWFWQALEAQGYRYSSSLFPLRTFLYGDSSAPRFSHNIGNLLEVPPSTITLLGRRMAFSGGFYLRLVPAVLLDAAAARINRAGQPVIFYIHPREIDPRQPRLQGLSTAERFIQYYNVGNTFSKLERILNRYNTCSIREYFRL